MSSENVTVSQIVCNDVGLLHTITCGIESNRRIDFVNQL